MRVWVAHLHISHCCSAQFNSFLLLLLHSCSVFMENWDFRFHLHIHCSGRIFILSWWYANIYIKSWDQTELEPNDLERSETDKNFSIAWKWSWTWGKVRFEIMTMNHIYFIIYINSFHSHIELIKYIVFVTL